MFPTQRTRFARGLARLGAILGLLIAWAAAAGPAGAATSGLSGQIAFFAQGNIFVLDLATHGLRQLTQDGLSAEPAWSPDGRRLAFSRRQAGGSDANIYLMNPDGSGVTQISNSPGANEFPAWGADGALFFVSDSPDPGGHSIAILRIDPAGSESLLHREVTGLCSPLDLSVSPGGIPAVTFDCGQGSYVYTVDPATGRLVDLVQGAAPPLTGCADDGVWAHTRAVLAVLFRPDCTLSAGDALYTLDFARQPAASARVAIGTDLRSVAWSWDDRMLAYANGSGLWVRDSGGQVQQLSTHGTHPSWRPGAVTMPAGAPPGMPATGGGGSWPGVLIALGAALLVGGRALRGRARRLA